MMSSRSDFWWPCLQAFICWSHLNGSSEPKGPEETSRPHPAAGGGSARGHLSLPPSVFSPLKSDTRFHRKMMSRFREGSRCFTFSKDIGSGTSKIYICSILLTQAKHMSSLDLREWRENTQIFFILSPTLSLIEKGLSHWKDAWGPGEEWLLGKHHYNGFL